MRLRSDERAGHGTIPPRPIHRFGLEPNVPLDMCALYAYVTFVCDLEWP